MRDKKGRFVKGDVPWIKGKTKKTNKTLRKGAEKISRTRKRLFREGKLKPVIKKGQTLEERYSEERAKIIKKKFSKSHMNKSPNNKKELNELEIIKLYKENKISTNKIAKQFNCSSTPILRILNENKINLYPNGFFQKGKVGWNKGLTKETDVRVRRIVEKTGRTLKRLYKEGKLINPFKGKKASLKTKRKQSKIRKKLYSEGKIIPPMNNPKTREKDSLAHKKLWEDEEFKEKRRKSLFKGMRLKPNKPEKVMINLIKQNNFPFNYVGNGSIIIGGFNPDFLSKNPKYIIELNGDYWHNLPNIIKKDKRKYKTYSKYGYKTLVIWEHELKNISNVKNKILRFIK